MTRKPLIQSVRDNLKNLYRKTLEEADQQEIFQAVSYAVKDVIIDRWLATQQVFDKEDPKIVYYMSMEFLMGRALGNNLINLTAYKEVREALDEMGLNLECDRGSGAGSGTWKRWSGTTGCLLYGFPRHTRIRGLRLRDPLSLRYVQAEDSGRLSGRSAG